MQYMMKPIYYIIMATAHLIGLLLFGCALDGNQNTNRDDSTNNEQTKHSRDTTTIIYNITTNNNITTTIDIEGSTMNVKVIDNNTTNNDIKVVQEITSIIDGG